MKFFFALLACVVCPVAFAAPPPAPSITVAATDIRQLEFNWDPVPGAIGYGVARASSANGQYVSRVVTDTTMAIDRQAYGGSTPYYEVTAITDAGTSLPSAVFSPGLLPSTGTATPCAI